MEKEEKKLEYQIKQLAKQGQTQACKALAKQLINVRNQKTKTIAANSRIGSVGGQVKAMGANIAVAGAVAQSSQAMKTVNALMPAEKMSTTLKNFEQEMMKMDMKDEMLDDALESVLGESDDEEETNALVSGVLDEIGIEVSEKLSKVKVPSGSVAGGSKSKVSDDFDIDKFLSEKNAALKM